MQSSKGNNGLFQLESPSRKFMLPELQQQLDVKGHWTKGSADLSLTVEWVISSSPFLPRLLHCARLGNIQSYVWTLHNNTHVAWGCH